MRIGVFFWALILSVDAYSAEISVDEFPAKGAITERGTKLPELNVVRNRSLDGRYGSTCFEGAFDIGEPVCRISILQLIANPEGFHSKNVEIQGVVDVNDGLVFLYFDKERLESQDLAASVYLGRKELIEEAFGRIRPGVSQRIVGKFSATDTGPDQLRIGTLVEVWSVGA